MNSPALINPIILVHAAPSLAAQDIYYQNYKIRPGLAYGMADGNYTLNQDDAKGRLLSASPAGDSLQRTASLTTAFANQDNYVIFLTDTGKGGPAFVFGLTDYTPPARGFAQVRVANLAPTTDSINISLAQNGSVRQAFAGVKYATKLPAGGIFSAFATVPAGQYRYTITNAADDALLDTIPNQALLTGKTYTLYFRGNPAIAERPYEMSVLQHIK